MAIKDYYSDKSYTGGVGSNSSYGKSQVASVPFENKGSGFNLKDNTYSKPTSYNTGTKDSDIFK